MSRFFRTAADSDSSSSSDEEELMSSGDEAPKPVQPKTPMSRFLKTGSGSDSSSSSDDDDESDDDSEDDGGGRAAPQAKKSRFIKGGADSDSDESSDEEKRVVKSAKDKRLEELQAIGLNIENKLKIGDWVATSTEYDKLARLVEKRTNVSEPVPPYWIKTLLSLDASLMVTKEKDPKKKINASNAKALNGMKNKVKKASKEYEDQIKRYQEDADKYEREYAAFFEPVAAAPPSRTTASAKNQTAAEGEEEGDGFTAVGKGGKSVQYTAESIFKVLAQINENRGKKNTDRVEQVKTLEKLLAVAVTTYQRIRVILALMSARFDYNPSATHMPVDTWSSAQKEFDQLVLILVEEPEYSVQEVVGEEYDESVERTPKTEGGVVRIRGSVISFVDRLDDEFTRSLQNIDPHGTEYIERLRDEKSLYQSICRAQCYFETSKQEDPLARVISRRLEHIYSKPDAVVEALEQVVDGDKALQPSLSLSAAGGARQLVHFIAIILYKSRNSLLRTRAMLCHIYHHALHNDFHTARDMLLMSHLQDSIHAADVATQILYNRVEVQLGLCAFRCGLIKESQSLLHEIFSTQRVKELLAQGLHQQRFVTLTPEQEKAERTRQVPFHMHINTELAEAAFLVSSMLVEIPVLASLDNEEVKRKTISKPFRRLLDHANRQVFNGPPENTRDHIMQASKALQDGEWERARNLIQSIAIWNLMPEAKQVKEMLARRIQEEGLRTYLFSNAPYYTTLSLSLLSGIFALPLRQVTSIVSKMIWNEELAASLDQAAGVVVFHRVEPTRLQQLAVTLSEKVAQLVEQNEKTLDGKLGGDRTWGERGDGKGGEKRGEQQVTGERRQRTGTRGGFRGGSRGRGARFAQGLGGQVTSAVRA